MLRKCRDTEQRYKDSAWTFAEMPVGRYEVVILREHEQVVAIGPAIPP